MVFDGTPTADSLIACGPGEVGLRARAGRTYYVMAFSDTDVNGGNLVLTLQNAPTPRVHVSLAKRGWLSMAAPPSFTAPTPARTPRASPRRTPTCCSAPGG